MLYVGIKPNRSIPLDQVIVGPASDARWRGVDIYMWYPGQDVSVDILEARDQEKGYTPYIEHMARLEAEYQAAERAGAFS